MTTEAPMTRDQMIARMHSAPGKPAAGGNGAQVERPSASDKALLDLTRRSRDLLAEIAIGLQTIGQNDSREVTEFAEYLDRQVGNFVEAILAKKRRELATLERAFGRRSEP